MIEIQIKEKKSTSKFSEDEDSNNNPAKHAQRASLLPLDDEEAILNDLLGENDNNNDNNDNVYPQVKDNDGNSPGLDDGGLDDNTQETVLEDNGVYFYLSSTLIIY